MQGQRVRRGTILGILLIAGSGVYTMMNNGFLHRLPESWALNVPFTGVVSVENPGDAGPAGLLKDLPASEKSQVRIVSDGAPTFEDGAVVGQQAYRDALKGRIDRSPDLERRREGSAQAGTGQKGYYGDPQSSGRVASR